MKWLWYSSLFFWIAIYISAPTVSAQAERQAGLSFLLIALMLSGFGFALLASRIPIGIATTRKNKRVLISIGILSVALGNAAVYFFPQSTIPLFILKPALGLGAGFWVVYSVFYVNQYLSERAQHKELGETIRQPMARIAATHGWGVAIGAVFGGWLVQQWGWHSPFLIGLIAAGLAAVALLWVHEQRGPSIPFSMATLRASFSDRRLVGISLIGALVFFVLSSTGWGFTQNFAKEAAPWQLAVIASAMFIPYALGLRYSYMARQRLGVKWLVVLGLGISGAAVFLVPLSQSIVWLSFLHILIGAGLGTVYSTLISLSIENAAPEHWGEVMGVFQTIYALGFLAGPLTAGVVEKAFGIEYIFYVDGTLTLLVALLIPPILLLSQPQSRLAAALRSRKRLLGKRV